MLPDAKSMRRESSQMEIFISIYLLGFFLGEISCTFSSSTKKLKCGEKTCSANSDKTPLGYYRLGAVEWNSGKKRSWLNLYPKKKNGLGYWDYYCENPDTKRSKIALHPGSISLGCVSIPDAVCWEALEKIFKNHSSTTISVNGVERSGWGSVTTFSCKGSLAAGKTKMKTVSVIGSLHVID